MSVEIVHEVNGDYRQQGCQYLGNLEGKHLSNNFKPIGFHNKGLVRVTWWIPFRLLPY
jgi:hypothetical protein